jgi:hypothetical protein
MSWLFPHLYTVSLRATRLLGMSTVGSIELMWGFSGTGNLPEPLRSNHTQPTLLQLGQTVMLTSGMTDLKYWFPIGGPHFFTITSSLWRDSSTRRPHTTGTNVSTFYINNYIKVWSIQTPRKTTYTCQPSIHIDWFFWNAVSLSPAQQHVRTV